MSRSNHGELPALKIEGGLFSTGIVRRLIARELPGSEVASYHLDEGYTQGEAVTRSWNRMQAAWRVFAKERERLRAVDGQASTDAEPGAGTTRDKLLLPLFEELGYGRLPYSGGIEVGGERFPITHQWNGVPIHLVGADTELDRRTEGVAGAAKRSPHGLVLEFLNRDGGSLWGFASNGLQLRLLRENRSIARQSYIEFDLEAILAGESYADFTALWMLCHESRLEAKGEESILERWRKEGVDEGERALKDLRIGVAKAAEIIGSGFLRHRSNEALREALRKGASSGGLDGSDFYHELLRLAYRLIFLFVAEDRDALLDPGAAPEAKRRYLEHYSTRRLRDLAHTIRGGGHCDLWRGLLVVMGILADKGEPDLALQALGSFLWETESIAHVASCELTNWDLLAAIRTLAFTERSGALWPTDFRNLGSDELGSVYEGLLELHPEIDVGAGLLALASTAGNERKLSGSYYTPVELVERLLDEALDPVLEKAAAAPDPETAILGLKVCDPAMGSGHFLTAAAARIAKRLAQVRTGEAEPGPEPLRHAMADVVQNCIYGVDINLLAVELGKISLWMEALEPGRPLSFLDHHLKCGNSLVGTTRELMAKGIPEGAFTELTGDDKTTVKAAKKRNGEYKGYSGGLFEEEELFPDYGKIVDRFSHLGDIDETTLEGVRLLATRYRHIVEAPEYLAELSAANGWCAAFFQPKRPDTIEPITQEQFALWLRDPSRIAKPLRDLAESLAARVGFFHWELAFPEVLRPADGKVGGFDVVLGNPPWEQVQFREQEWFAERNPAIAGAPNADRRKQMIAALERDHDPLFYEYQQALRDIECIANFYKTSDRYPLCGRGKINLFAIFSELGRSLLSPEGRLGIIVPSGIATDDTTKNFFADLVVKRVLISLFDFENQGIFPDVHNSYKFCLLTVSGSLQSTKSIVRFVFFAHSTTELREPERIIELTGQDFLRMNPNTKTTPIFRSRRDADITRRVYDRVPVLIREGSPADNPWGLTFRQGLFNMASDSGLFRSQTELEAEGFKLAGSSFVKGEGTFLPLYEAKMIHHYDHRWATYDGRDSRDTTESEKAVPGFEVLPRYWISKSEVDAKIEGRWNREWFMGWRDICRSTDERTVISSFVPKAAVGDTLLLMLPSVKDGWILVANFDSVCLDFLCRQKIGGTHLKYPTTKQLPILPPSAYSISCPWNPEAGTVTDWIKPRVLELVYTSDSLEPFARDQGYAGRPFRWDPERRFVLRCELDAAFFHLYGIEREDADYILETFPIVKRHDEEEFGEYRTKRVILEIYDALAEAIRSNRLYLSRLDPKPGEIVTSQAKKIPVEEFIAMAYPSSEADRAVCAAALAAVEQSNGLTSMDHLDVLLLATHPDWCKSFLDTTEVRALENALRSAPAALSFGEDQSICWKDCLQHLVHRDAITVNHSRQQTITVGSQFATVKAGLPGGVDGVMEYAFKALKAIVEIRKTLPSAPQMQQTILSILERQHQQYGLAA